MFNLLLCTGKYQSYGGQGVLTAKVDPSLLGTYVCVQMLQSVHTGCTCMYVRHYICICVVIFH